LHVDLFGHDGDGVYDLQRLFDEQVQDEENRPWAWRNGEYAYRMYKEYGLYGELLEELRSSTEEPKFEFTLEGEINGIPLKGKPDLWYKRDIQVVYDWKVMGYCANSAQSPKKFYKSCRDCWTDERAKATRGGGHAKPHPKYEAMEHHGHTIGAHWMEDVDKKWADQIAIYCWMSGVEVGDESCVVGIDQLACKPSPLRDSEDEATKSEERMPLIRVAQHRCRISSFWQHSLMDRIQSMWDTINSGHIFTDMSREDSDARCEVLDLGQPSDDNDDFWAMVNEKQFRG
jgi:hypothetical protein